jgi:hypothetical protein
MVFPLPGGGSCVTSASAVVCRLCHPSHFPLPGGARASLRLVPSFAVYAIQDINQAVRRTSLLLSQSFAVRSAPRWSLPPFGYSILLRTFFIHYD